MNTAPSSENAAPTAFRIARIEMPSGRVKRSGSGGSSVAPAGNRGAELPIGG